MADTFNRISRASLLAGFLCVTLAVAAGCGVVGDTFTTLIDVDQPSNRNLSQQEQSDYYNKFYEAISIRGLRKSGTKNIIALDGLPKDVTNQPNWTTAVVEGLISPRGSLDPNAEEEAPFELNIFLEAKVPLMANVIFPHSIHTYWLSCKVCHPKIFVPEAGANDITMDEIFQGEWCGRCHGKVAFTFWPRQNCTRCHNILKGQSLQKEKWR